MILLIQIQTRRHHKSRLLDIKKLEEDNQPFIGLIDRINKNNLNGINFLQIDSKDQPYENKDSVAEKSENQTIFDLIVTHNKHIKEHDLKDVDILKKSITTVKVNDKESKQIKVVISVKQDQNVRFWCNELDLHKEDNRIIVKDQLHEKFEVLGHALKKCGFKDFLGEKELMTKHHSEKPEHHHNVNTDKEIIDNKHGNTTNTKKNEDAYYKDDNTEKKFNKEENKSESQKNLKNGTQSSSSTSSSVSYSNTTSTGDLKDLPEGFDF